MFKYFLYFISVLLMLVIYFGFTLSVAQYKSSPSDHFSGKVFFNTETTNKGSFLKALTWLISRKVPDWQAMHYARDLDLTKPVQNIRITPIIHASVFIQTPKFNILTDPIWSERASPFSFAGPKRVYEPPIKISELSRVDIVLISHNHYDHLDIATIKKIQELYSPVFITGLGNKSLLKSIGAKKVIELDWWQKAKDLPVTFMPAQHFSGRGLFDRNYTLWGGFLIEANDEKIYFAGDTGYAGFFKQIHNKYGSIDVAILPIGAYLPRYFMKPMHLNPDDAVRAMLDLHAKKAMAIHFDSFARLADEPQFSAPKDLYESLKQRGLDLKRFIAPVPGKSYLF